MDDYLDNMAPAGSVWRHKKTGGVYAVVGWCFLEHSGNRAVLYQKPTDRLPWARDADEFLDGRFERLPEPPQDKADEGECG